MAPSARYTALEHVIDVKGETTGGGGGLLIVTTIQTKTLRGWLANTRHSSTLRRLMIRPWEWKSIIITSRRATLTLNIPTATTPSSSRWRWIGSERRWWKRTTSRLKIKKIKTSGSSCVVSNKVYLKIRRRKQGCGASHIELMHSRVSTKSL